MPADTRTTRAPRLAIAHGAETAKASGTCAATAATTSRSIADGTRDHDTT